MQPLLKLLRRARHGEPIVVVSGLPRSGTSMAMKMLEAGGMAVVTDGQRAADEDNPRGYYEDERVKSLHRDTDRRWLREARGRAVKIISFLLRSLPADNNYKVIFMHRDLREVVASQNRMLARRGEPPGQSDDEAARLLDKELDDARFFLRRPHFEVLEVHYKSAVGDARSEARRMAEFVGRSLDIDKMASVVSAELYRNRG